MYNNVQMTLIVGTIHWKGICFTSDTRATRYTSTGDKTYEDNALKVDIIPGGFGIAAAGDKLTNVIYKSLLSKIASEVMTEHQSGKAVVLSDPYLKLLQILKTSLTSVIKHPAMQKRVNTYKESIVIRGLIGTYDQKLPFRLNKGECENLIGILVQSPNLNSVYSKYIEQISACSQGIIPFVEMPEFYQQYLYTYYLKIENKKVQKADIQTVPFGKIAAFGSGSEFAYQVVEPRVLGWVLFSREANDLQTAAMHLAQIHGYAIKEDIKTPGFDFRTYGGGIVPSVLISQGANSEMQIVLGDMYAKPDRKFISEVFEKNNKLWIKTEKNEEHELVKFPDIHVPDEILLTL